MSFRIFTLLEKNIKQLVRSKRSSLIIILGPLFIILVAGIALTGAALKDISLSMYSSTENSYQHSLVQRFEEHGIHVTEANTLGECKSLVKEGATNLCVEIQKRESSLTQYDPRFGYQLGFYVDYSKVRLVWTVINTIKSIVEQENREITTQILTKTAQNLQTIAQQIAEKRILLDAAIEKGEFVQENFGTIRESVDALVSFSDTIQSSDLQHLQTLLDSQITGLNTFYTAISPFVTSQGKGQLDTYYTTTKSSLNELNLQLNKVIVVNNRLLADVDKIGGKSTLRNRLDQMQTNLNTNLQELREVQRALTDVQYQIQQFQGVNFQDILTPIPIVINPVAEGQVAPASTVPSSFLEYLLPALLALVVLFVAPLLGSTLTMKERKSKAYFRNLIAPLPRSLFTLGIYLTGLFLVLVQVTILLVIANFIFHVEIFENIFPIFLILFLIISAFTFIGICLGFFFNAEETALLAATSLSIIGLILSEFILPIETAPSLIGKLVSINPFVVTETVLRKLLIFNLPFRSIITDILILLGYLIVSIGLALLAIKFSNKEIR